MGRVWVGHGQGMGRAWVGDGQGTILVLARRRFFCEYALLPHALMHALAPLQHHPHGDSAGVHQDAPHGGEEEP